MTRRTPLPDQPFLPQLAGVDEVGRGPLAGPVVAAAVIIPTQALWQQLLPQLNDSKKMSEVQRHDAAQLIRRTCIVRLAAATVAEIDQLNILQASLLAMTRAVSKLPMTPQHIWVDGNRAPSFNNEAHVRTIVKGDASCLPIAAASIVAKVCRDQLMQRLHRRFPQFGFAVHAGYPTPQHLDALANYPPSPHHRMSFAPVKQAQRR